MNGPHWDLYLEQLPLLADTLRLLVRGVRQKLQRRPLRVSRDAIGRQYRGRTICATPRKIGQFAKALQDRNPSYDPSAANGELVAPPLFGILPTMHSLVSLFSDRELQVDFPNLLLIGQQSDFFRLIRPGEKVRAVSTIADVTDRKGGQCLTIQSEGSTELGDPLFRDHAIFYIRDRSKLFSGLRDLRRGQDLWAPSGNSPIVQLADCPIPAGQIGRYSRISGDYNPFHYFRAIARMFGYSGKFLQGTALTAIVSQLVINGLLAGDPHRLKRISLSLWEKVVEGDILKTRAWLLDPGRFEGASYWHDPRGPSEAAGAVIGFQVMDRENQPIVPGGAALVTGPLPTLQRP